MPCLCWGVCTFMMPIKPFFLMKSFFLHSSFICLLLLSTSTFAQQKKSPMKNPLFPQLTTYLKNIEASFAEIPEERREALAEISEYLLAQVRKKQSANFIFICTHNSRRSHFSQVWASVAAYYYGFEGVACYSGGTEATAFNPRAVAALERVGLQVLAKEGSENPRYRLVMGKDAPTITAFSKKYAEGGNPTKDFAAVMTCSQADEACPIVFGASKRIALPYEDPKAADGSAQESQVYDERCRQIAVEIFYAFHLAAQKQK